MKKLIALMLLVVFCYGFTYTNCGTAIVPNTTMKNETLLHHIGTPEMVIHPLQFFALKYLFQ